MIKVGSGQSSVHKTGEVELIDRRYDHPDAALLLRAFRGEQVERYGFAEPIEADPSEFEDPNGVFLVAYSNSRIGGCAGLHWFDRKPGIAVNPLESWRTRYAAWASLAWAMYRS